MHEMQRALFVGSTLESQHTSDLAAHLTAALFGSIDDTTDAEVDEPND